MCSRGSRPSPWKAITGTAAISLLSRFSRRAFVAGLENRVVCTPRRGLIGSCRISRESSDCAPIDVPCRKIATPALRSPARHTSHAPITRGTKRCATGAPQPILYLINTYFGGGTLYTYQTRYPTLPCDRALTSARFFDFPQGHFPPRFLGFVESMLIPQHQTPERCVFHGG